MTTQTVTTGITMHAGTITLEKAQSVVARYCKKMEAEPNLGKWAKLKLVWEQHKAYVKQLTK
jgi:hypothetical protein